MHLPGAEPVQAVVLQQISGTLGSMAQEAGSERQFRENLAQEYLLLAQLLEQHLQHGLTAVSEAKRGLAVLQPQLAAQPSARASQLETELRNVC
ncbi:MAG: hypothetical protein P4L03_00445 [Terracidiphilus sp.]|nr:hypothetical protein [Terracidiphilus sp.]